MFLRPFISTVFNVGKRSYHARVMDHYENPRNVGSLNKKDKNVGTGLVGAPACFHGDTLIATADAKRYATLIDIYESKQQIPVWSFNIEKEKYEIKWAIAIKTGKRKMVKLSFDNGGTLTCTHDHKFLTKCNGNYMYLENGKLEKEKNISLVTFDSESYINSEIMKRDYLEEDMDCFNLQVEENNNYVVLTSITPTLLRMSEDVLMGICVKNCGDVMKIQILVDPKTNTIIDSKFKTFGCGSAIASSSYSTEIIKGKTIEESLLVTNKEITNHLKLPQIKTHCSLLSEDAIKMAVADYKKKQNE